MGGLFLLLVLVAEYISLDPEDLRQPIAAAGLNALAYALFLILVVSVRSLGLRLFATLPTLSIAAGLMTLRVLELRFKKGWMMPQALVSLAVIAQFTAAMHYLPLPPAMFGLALLGLLYAIINFMINLEEALPMRQAVIEPLVVVTIVFALAIFIR